MLNSILELLNTRKNKILLVAEAALPERQFLAFKKVFLDELGMRGFESELVQLMEEFNSVDYGVGMGRNILSKKGGGKMIE